MIDLLVSMAIISILIGILLPAVGKVRESTRKVICGSNLRQIGMGMSLYSQDSKDRLPDSVFLPPPRSNTLSAPALHRMDTVRITAAEFPQLRGNLWDGMGKLYDKEYITAPNIYYCPSHHGSFMFQDAADDWNRAGRHGADGRGAAGQGAAGQEADGQKEIIVNYIFRGTGPDGSRVLYNIDSGAGLVTDTLRSYEDLNHEGGFNILQAGLAVNWFEDVGDEIAQEILLRAEDDNKSSTVVDAWDRLDGLEERLSHPQLGDE